MLTKCAVCTIMILYISSFWSVAAAAVCSKGMTPTQCAEAQLEAISTILADYKKETARLEAEIAEVRQERAKSDSDAINKQEFVVNNESKTRRFGSVNQNKTKKVLFVFVTATKASNGNTMYANVSKQVGDLPTISANSTTVAAVSFIAPSGPYAHQISFAVPPDYWYNVSTDGGDEGIAYWVEVAD